MLKRGYKGTYHKMSVKHLARLRQQQKNLIGNSWKASSSRFPTAKAYKGWHGGKIKHL
jgi:hypothetical protein